MGNAKRLEISKERLICLTIDDSCVSQRRRINELTRFVPNLEAPVGVIEQQGERAVIGMSGCSEPILERFSGRFGIINHTEKMVLGLYMGKEKVGLHVDLLGKRRQKLEMNLMALFEEGVHVGAELGPVSGPLVRPRGIIVVANVESLLLVGSASVTGSSLWREPAVEGL